MDDEKMTLRLCVFIVFIREGDFNRRLIHKGLVQQLRSCFEHHFHSMLFGGYRVDDGFQSIHLKRFREKG